MILTKEYSRVAAIYDKENRSPGHGTYYDIGHGEKGYLLWIWLGGEIVTSHVAEGDGSDDELYHDILWPNVSSSAFAGRFEVDTGELSVVVPLRWQHRPVPESLLDALERKFQPKNIHIY